MQSNDILKSVHNDVEEREGTNMGNHQEILAEMADSCLRELVQKKTENCGI